MRGKHDLIDGYQPKKRSIPAHAGETIAVAPYSTPSLVNPRSCGGNQKPSMTGLWRSGQSPLMRGKRLPKRNKTTKIWSIPAHAGETFCFSSVITAFRVNPRSCGGNGDKRDPRRDARGQSPLMRGKLSPECSGLKIGRSIPAHAGETAFAGADFEASAVNPRSCGGNHP